MKRFLLTLPVIALLLGAASARAQEKTCTLCVGAVVTPSGVAEGIPMLMRLPEGDFATAGAGLDALTPAQRAMLTVLVPLTIEGEEPLLAAEAKAKTVAEWARLRGPFDTLAVAVQHPDPAIVAYTIKRISVAAQGLNVARRLGVAGADASMLEKLSTPGATPYFDVVVAEGKEVEPVAAWLAANDPSKKIYAIVEPRSPNPLYDVAGALAAGAVRAYFASGASAQAIANLNRALSGEFAYDSTARPSILDSRGAAKEMPALTFVRGEDLRTLIIPRGEELLSFIIAMPADRYRWPTRISEAGAQEISDSAQQGGRLLIGVAPPRTPAPYLIAVNYAQSNAANITREAIDVATQRGITVEEIIRNHQAHQAFQESIEPRYIARNTTKLRFGIGGGADSVEATLAGDYFSDPEGRADWVWQDFLINGVKWKYGRIPELPLIQPEKVTQLPLDIHLTNEYRYNLVRETDLGGYRVYEVRFEPPPNAPPSLPLYRGTVWIDGRTWARVRINMVQLNLTGEVLSNEERVDFQPFARDSYQPLAASEVYARAPQSILWLPSSVAAQQVISAAGRAAAVERATIFSEFRINPSDYAERLQRVAASDARMVRETEAGLRYLEKRGDGERVVKEGFDTSQLFMVGGIHHDAGLEFPVVPLGGIDYFNFNLGNRGIQTNVIFAGVILAVNATHPNVGNTRTNLGTDLFAIAIPFENTMYRQGEEQPREGVKERPMSFTLRAGHPVFQFGKVDLSLTARHSSFSRGEETASDFRVPSSTFTLQPALDLSYARRGYSISGFFEYNRRTSWEPWGYLHEYDENQRSFSRFGASIGKSFHLPRFQRISLDLNYMDGQRLDRFSKYELGFFGARRVHGIKSGSVRAERGFIGHISYGFVFSQQFRLEAFYDHALLDDQSAGLRRAPFQGVGIAGQTVGPYGTLLRLDIGKTIGRNAQDGFVANVVFLKLF